MTDRRAKQNTAAMGHCPFLSPENPLNIVAKHQHCTQASTLLPSINLAACGLAANLPSEVYHHATHLMYIA